MKAHPPFAASLLAICVMAAPARALQEEDQVVLHTGYGDVVLELHRAAAPVSTQAFLDWYASAGHANHAFYRTVSPETDNGTPAITVLQGGLLPVPDEIEGMSHESTATTGLSNRAGAVAIARGDLGTGSPAYFFISLTDNPALDAGGGRHPDGEGFAVFARVVHGMEVVRAIHAQPVDPDQGDDYTRGQWIADPVPFTVTLVSARDH